MLFLTCCKEERTYRIGVSQCSSDDWRNKCNDEIYREIMLHPEATVEIRSADDNNEKQIADIRYFMDQGFDIIIAAPNEADAITPIIQEVYAKGIPVIIFDRNIHGDTYTAYQGVDNRGIGESAAHYARHLVGHGGRVLEICGLPGSTPAIERHEGFVDGAQRNGLQLVASACGNWNYQDAITVCDSLFPLYKDKVDLVYAHNDRMAVAASDAAHRHGLDILVIGIDAAPEIGLRAVADSVINATFLYPTEGYRLIRTALAILKQQPYDKRIILPKSSVVDLTNADILLLQNETLKAETDKIRVLKSQVDEYWNRHSIQTTLLYATIVVLVLLAGFLFLLLQAFWQRKKYQQELLRQNELLEQQRDTQKELNEQLNRATQSKLVFFTNVSHDLRTPLTLIAGPVEQLAAANNLTPTQQTLVRIANKNILILKRLINQILDFRKFENGKLELHMEEARFVPLVREWVESFRHVARSQDIQLSVEISVGEEFALALDVEKMERVFFNLMSNAFKYTPKNGRITFTCAEDGQYLVFSVTDTGQGISQEELGKVFDRFYQVDKIHPQGSGIGLALVKAFVELHHGVITAESRLGTGSRFTVTLPVTHVQKTAEEPVDLQQITAADVDAELGEVELSPTAVRTDCPLLLVIDDNEDIRHLLQLLLKDEYNVLTATNGKEGVRMAAKYVPDLILCDVMMPVMDGLECCRRIKEEISTSHIPVLILTACSMDEQRVKGYESGADGYIAKPFTGVVLKARCRNLIDNRQRIKQLWTGGRGLPSAGQQAAALSPSGTGNMENEFYARFLEIVQTEMANMELNVDVLASKMGLGRSQFYRKIKAITNYSPVELIRQLRLKRSRELLLTTEKSISEIAYEVGFSSPAYFTRCYREAFGETPTDLREKIAAKG